MDKLSNLICLSPVLLLLCLPFALAAHDYVQALSKSILFFEAQRSGYLPHNQRVTWRGHSGLQDGKASGVIASPQFSPYSHLNLNNVNGFLHYLPFFCCVLYSCSTRLVEISKPWLSKIESNRHMGLNFAVVLVQLQVDLVGGYYDAGDNVKFGLPMAFTVTMMSWSIIEYGKQMAANGELGHAMEAVKWGTDYFIKAHPQPDVLYGEVSSFSTSPFLPPKFFNLRIYSLCR